MKSSSGTGRNREDARACVKEASEGFRDPKLIFFFSDEKKFPEYAALIHEMFPEALSIGCSAYRNFNSEGTEVEVLDMLAVEDGIICAGGVIERADNFALGSADSVKECYEKVGTSENTVCVEFTLPGKGSEEFALMALNSVLLRKEIPIVGGTASNVYSENFAEHDMFIAMNGKVYTQGCVFAIIHNCGGKIHISRENIYEPLTGNEITVTKANSVTRTVMNCGGHTASETYAKELGVPENEIQNYFFNYPIGRREGDELYITAIYGVGSGGSMKNLARVHEGTKVMVMKEGDYRSVIGRAMEKIKENAKSVSFLLTIQCMACTLLFEQHGYIDEYQKTITDAFPNMIGFSAFGEQLGTKHFNHTIITVAFE